MAVAPITTSLPPAGSGAVTMATTGVLAGPVTRTVPLPMPLPRPCRAAGLGTVVVRATGAGSALLPATDAVPVRRHPIPSGAALVPVTGPAFALTHPTGPGAVFVPPAGSSRVIIVAVTGSTAVRTVVSASGHA
ncbi:hypothetical protein AQJ67_23940 [Streptomyces caeruleatus]|uniref:Uncharacterized protein n=1 Tax=Streptomyces caeruleatus TaxID=661399 RepID=A0A101TXB2_9ACTN|nr:hypothetical protein AQJ67_23940 [Streptomyces caeruleatus]